MALPIKETPILRGKAAKKFREKRLEVEKKKISVPIEDYKRAEKVFYEMNEKSPLPNYL